MSIRRVIALARKEMRHIWRDSRIMFMTVIAPAFVLFLLAYTYEADLQLTRIGVLDLDRSATARQYLATLTGDGDVQIVQYVRSYAEANDLLVRGAVDATVVIPPGFGTSVVTGDPLALQLVQDGSDYWGSEGIYR